MKAYVKLASQILIIFFAAVSSASSGKGHLQKIWELRLSDVLQDAGTKSFPLSIFGLSFSPEGQRVLVVYGPNWKEEKVVVLNATDPKTDVKEFDINPQYWESSVPPTGAYIRWSGQNAAIGHLMVQLSDGSSCLFPDHTFALPFGTDEVIHSWFQYYNWKCHPLGEFNHPANWKLLDVSAERKLFCVRKDTIQSKYAVHSDILVVDAITGTSLFKVPCLAQMARFAGSGKYICGMRTHGSSGKQTVSCWDIETGKESANLRKNDYVDIQPALTSARIAIF